MELLQQGPDGGLPHRPVHPMTFLFSDQYGIASEMMCYVPAHPKTYNIPLGRRMNPFDVWGGTEEALGIR